MTTKQARRARDAGISRAVTHADRAHDGWAAEARAVLEAFVRLRRKPFRVEEVRAVAHLYDLPDPPHARAWGGVVRGAAMDGLIRKIAVTTSEAAHCHCSHVGLWEVVR